MTVVFHKFALWSVYEIIRTENFFANMVQENKLDLFINPLCINIGVHEYSKNVEATSKF